LANYTKIIAAFFIFLYSAKTRLLGHYYNANLHY